MGTYRLSSHILCVLYVLSVLWNPVLSEDKCLKGCTGAASGATFLKGHKYNYGVEGTVSIFLTGADHKETSVKLLGQVTVSALGNCAYVLKVQNLVISGPDGKKYNKPPGLEKPVRFTLQDGRVGSDICSEEGETRRSLNIKRAIISLLQTEQRPSTQIDIFGACPTEVSSSQEGGAVLVHRTRDLSRCAHREQGKNDLITAIVNPTAEIKDSQVLQSILNVESKVNNGVPEKIAATEEYLYKPFSLGENGARAKVHTKLTLTGKSAGADEGAFKEPRTIIFENPHGATSDTSNLQSALKIVKETANTLTTEASSKSAGKFAQVVRIFRTTSKDDLLNVYNQCKASNLEKRVFLDGLLRAGTGASIEASIQILKSSSLSSLEQELVFLSLGNARHVNNDALKAASGLLDLPNLPKEIYLGVGALAGIYCREHNCHSAKSEGIVALSNKLGAKLQNCKPKSKVEEDYVVAVLKGIRNIRHLEDSLIDKVVHCAVDHSVKNRVRAAALEAFQADPCASKIKKTGIDLMKNRQLDSEIRIKAYLAVIACPCGQSANQIKNLLDSEPVHQVGRFITTSLRHIRSSSNPDKRLARQHYGQIRTPNKFNVDDRKYSFYREASYNVDALGVGGSIEETVIYSQDSFLPRSATLNLTAELFGHSLNVLEIGGRQGNLDRVVEHFLGPKGILNPKNPQALYDDLVKRFQEAEQRVEKGIQRGRRSVKAEIDNFDKHVKAESAPYNNELDLDLYLKLFGTDAVFLSLGDDKGFDLNKFIDQILKSANEGINKAKHFQQEIRAHLLFLDAELAYPTSTGLPIKLDLVGSATARVDVATNVDIRQCIRSPQNAKLDIKLVPSTDIEVSGYFLVDADVVATGLKVVTNLHSSTGGHLIAKVLENGHGIDLQFALPIEKQEIITASNDLVYVTAEKGQVGTVLPLKVDSDTKEYSGCFDQLSGVLGLTLCGEVSAPFVVSNRPEDQASISKFLARYPLTGASKVKLVLEKNDLKGYRIKGVLHTDNPQRRTFDLLFEAEGSKNRRTHFTGELANTAEEKTLKINLESPIKTVGGQVSIYTKPNEYVALVKAKLDAAEYYGRVGFNVQGNQQRSVFKPVVEYQLPDEHGKKSLKVDGQLIREVNGLTTKYTFEGIKVNLPNTNDVVDINGHVKLEPKNADLELKAKKGEHHLILSGSLKGQDLKLEFQNTLNPYVNFRAIGHSEFGETIHNKLDLTYGDDLRSNQNRLTFNQFLKYNKKSVNDYGVITKNELTIHAIPLKAKVDADVDPKKLDIEVEGQYIDKKGKFDLEARTQIKKQGDYSVKVITDVDNKGFEVVAKRDIVSPEKSNLENYIVIKGVGRYELSGVVLHKNKPNDLNVGAVGHLKISGAGKNEDIKFDIGAIDTPKLYSSHAKISGSQGDILDYLLKLTKGANADGQLKLILKDTIAANGHFKVTDNDGKGNGVVIVDFKKIQRKIKGEVKFVVKDPVYNADIDLYLNFEKDNNDKVCITTNTRKTDKLIDSKNKIEYGGKKAELNVKQEGIIDLQGKGQSFIEVVLPTERCISLKYNREASTHNDLYNSVNEVVLSDATKRGGEASTIVYKDRVVNSNFEKDTINYDGQVELKLKGGKNLQYVYSLKNTPGEKSKFEFKSDINGNLIPKPASLLVTMDYTGIDEIDGTEDYRVKGSYGNDFAFELVGKGETKLFEKGDKKILDDSTLTIRLPFEKAHDLKFVSTYVFIQSKEVFEYTIVESAQINADLYKVDASGKLGLKNGYNKIKVLVPHVDPVTLDVNYKANLDGERKNANVDVKALYGKGKSAAISAEAVSAPQDYSLAIKANAPEAEKLKKLEIKIHSKKPTADTVNTQIIVDADGRVYKSESVVVSSSTHPLVDIKYTSPSNPKQSRIYLKANRGGAGVSSGEVKIENIQGLSYDSVAEANIQKDNFALKGTINCEALKLKNYVIKIETKDAGNGKRLEFHATNDNKNILSGSTSYISKQEGPKTIVEGSGTLKVNEQQKSANFKYIRTLLTEGNEQGVETFLNTAIGDRSYVAESRITNLEYKTSYVYCEEKKQCAHVDFLSKLNIKKPGSIQHLINVGLDLRKLGFAPEFGLQVSNEVSEEKLPQFNLDLHINKDERKYHLHIYEQPETGKFPAGITITLPHRVLALESLVTYPTDKALPFPIKGELAFHLDKNKPQQKAAARFLIDVNGNDKQYNAVAELGFSHPKLGKEACIKIRGQIQHPNDNTLKIESAASISYPSLGDRQSKVLVEVSPATIKVLVDTPLVKVIDLEGNSVAKENLLQGEVKLSILQSKPVQVRAVVKEFKYYELTTSYSEDSERKLSIVGRIDPEKRVEITADIVLPNVKKNIVHGALFLQDGYVKSDYGVSQDNVKYFLDALKKDLFSMEKRLRDLGEKAGNDLKDTLKRIEPTYKQLEASYKEELEKLYKEISDDKVLKEISEALHDIVQFVAKIVSEVIDVTKPIVDKVYATVAETYKKIEDLYEKQIEPQLKQLYASIAAVIKEFFDGLIDIVAHFVALVTDFFEKHKAELKELTNTIAEIFKDLTRLFVAQLKEFRVKAAKVFEEITQQIKELPVVNALKEKIQELVVPDNVIDILLKIHNTIRQFLPTEETKKFTDALYSYTVKKLRQEKCDDAKELRALYEKFAVALTSLVQFVRTQLNQLGIPALVFNVNSPYLIAGPSQTSLPSFGGSASFSLLNQILKGDVPDPLSIIRAYRPRSLNPLDEIPAKLRAVVVNGQHIFTFDGRHLTFPGNCRYVLVHDHVDRNFTLALALQNGAPKTLILEDKSGTTVEIKENGQVAVNGANHGFPVDDGDVFAFRQASGRIGLGSKYGLLALCTSKLEVCYIEVNGFYLGKLRGLLGDGNNEPYDDFRLPNGKISNSEAEFGNSYRLASSCPQVKTPEHSHHQHHSALPAACETVFGGSSPLRPLGLVLDISPFRQACIHAVHGLEGEKALHEACDLARGYAALAVTGLLPAVLPPACVRCTDISQPKNVGDTYKVKVAKEADIIVGFETTKATEKSYKELVVPLVSQLVDNLKGQHIEDIKVYLVGITPKMPYPIIYDTDLKLKTPKVQFNDESRVERIQSIVTGNESVDKYEKELIELLQFLKEKLTISNVLITYHSIFDLPLRPAAVKQAIIVVGEKCESRFAPIEAIRGIIYKELLEEAAINIVLVANTPGIKIGGGKNPDQIIGYAKDAVLLLGDKKPSESLRSTLEIEPDSCADFAETVGGAVISASNYVSCNPGQQKQFIQSAASILSGELLSKQVTKDCTCTYVDPFRVRSVCVNTAVKAASRRRK